MTLAPRRQKSDNINMRKFILLVGLTLCFSPALNAQGLPAVKRVFSKISAAWRKDTPAAQKTAAKAALSRATPQISARRAQEQANQILARATAQTRRFGGPVITALEKNINRFVFTITQADGTHPFTGTGFVVAEEYQGKTVLWGVTAKHTITPFHGPLEITFHTPHKPVKFRVKRVIEGRKFGLDAALLELPPQAAQVALPFPLTYALPAQGETVFAYGYGEGKYQKIVRKFLFSGDERLVAKYPLIRKPKPGFCGSPVVNAKGQLVGVEAGGYCAVQTQWYPMLKQLPQYKRQNIRRVSEIVPTSKIYLLLQEYHRAGAGARNIAANGILIGKLNVDEFIESVTVFYANGNHRTVVRNPFMNPAALESVIDTHNASGIVVNINKHRTQQRQYFLEMRTHEVREILQ